MISKIVNTKAEGNIHALGFMNYCSHDPAACLMKMSPSGDIDFMHFEEGMLSRKKKSYQFPLRSIQESLKYFDVNINEVDIVATDFMNEKTFFNTSRYYRKLIGDYFRAYLKIKPEQIHFSQSHHLAHAYTAFYPSGFESAAVLVVDGLGSEQQTHSIFEASHKNGIKLLYSQKGNGIGLLYSLVTELLGFEDGEEGKTMGLAPYGEPYSDMDAKLPDLTGNSIGYCVDYSHLIQRSPSPKLKFNLEKNNSKKDVYSPLYSRLAFNLQKELERVIIHLANEIKEKTGLGNICFAGGVGLNCVANEILKESKIFNQVFVQPSSGDSGLPLGLAMIGLEEAAQKKGRKVDWRKNEKIFWTYAPVEFSNQKVKDILKTHNIESRPFNFDEVILTLQNKGVVAYFENGWEFGPRALGHRSFLADPRHKDMKDILNSKIKHREGYRPFAPIILEECFNDYFESSTSDHSHMMYAVKCKETTVALAPTIVHVDKTARVQTCNSSAGRIYNIISKFKDATGLPILVNTSFNDNNEPIVLNPLDALSCFLRTSADLLVIDDIMIFRNQIKNESKLLEIALEEQHKKNLSLMDGAIDTLLERPAKFESIPNFIARNLLSAIYFRKNASLDRLTRELCIEKKHKKYDQIVTDAYHSELLINLFRYNKVNFDTSKLVIIEDSFQSISKVPRNSFIILYDLSVLVSDSQILDKNAFLEGCESFYRSYDPKIILSLEENSSYSVFDEIKDSYEILATKEISEFFEKKVDSKFRELYLN